MADKKQTPEERIQELLEQRQTLNNSLVATVRNMVTDAKALQARFLTKLQNKGATHAIQWDTQDFYQAQCVLDTFEGVADSLHVDTAHQLPAREWAAGIVRQCTRDILRGSFQGGSTSDMRNLMDKWKALEHCAWVEKLQPLVTHFEEIKTELKTLGHTETFPTGS